jgi:hypothetical protein
MKNVLEQALEALKRCTKFDQRDYDAMDALEAAIANDALKHQWQREAFLEAKELLLRSCPFGSNPQAWYVNEIEQKAKELE